jgi:MFS family permease
VSTSSGSFSRSEIVKGLRYLLYTGALWGCYGQVASVGGAIFTGYALYLLGAKESDIGTLVSLASAVGLMQLLSFFITNRIRQKKNFVVYFGPWEMIFNLTTIFVPLLLPPTYRLPVVMVMIMVGMSVGHLVTPIFNSWFVALVPENTRGRYISRRTIVAYISTMVFSYGAGWIIDFFKKDYRGFLIIFIAGLIVGIGGYLVLMRTPFSGVKGVASVSYRQVITVPFRNKNFRAFLFFYVLWSFAAGIAGPFYNVFMIRRLELDYSTIAIFNNLTMAALIVGFQAWGGVVDRYGNKPILEILMIPTAVIPLFWVFIDKGNYYLIFIIATLSGLISAGTSVATSTLLYKLIPQEGENATFFACWSATASLANSIAPAIGGRLVKYLEPVELSLGYFTVGNLQIVFILSSLAMIPTVFMLGLVAEDRAATPRQLLAQLKRGNPLRFALSSFIFSHARREERRAQALWVMGRSRSPMAIRTLISALDYPSSEVRREAAKGLGETGDPAAVEPLIRKLLQGESDIRPEAAEALGKLRHPKGIEALLKILDDEDRYVRISAIRALERAKLPQVQESLFRKLKNEDDRSVFLALAESLSVMGEKGIIEPILKKIGYYLSQALKLQLLNCICRALGAGDAFYQLFSEGELERAARLVGLLERSRRDIIGNRSFDSKSKADLTVILNGLQADFESEDYTSISRTILNSLAVVESGKGEGSAFGDGPQAVAQERVKEYIQTIKLFLGSPAARDMPQEGAMFLIVCFLQVVKVFKGYD